MVSSLYGVLNWEVFYIYYFKGQQQELLNPSPGNGFLRRLPAMRDEMAPRHIQWCSGKFGAGGTLGGLGRSPQRGPGAQPLLWGSEGEAP